MSFTFRHFSLSRWVPRVVEYLNGVNFLFASSLIDTIFYLSKNSFLLCNHGPLPYREVTYLGTPMVPPRGHFITNFVQSKRDHPWLR